MLTETVAQSLEIMWKGMVSIFVVLLILSILVYLINRFIKDKK